MIDPTLSTLGDTEIQLLQKILSSLVGSRDGSAPLTITPNSAQRAIVFSTMSASGTIAAGHKSIDIIFSSTFTGSLGGVAFAGATDTAIELKATSGDTLGSIAVAVSAGSIRVVTVG